MITTFVLLTGKWTDALIPAARATGPLAAAFFAVAVVVGIYLIMNLFVAILLNAFAEDFVEKVSGVASGTGGVAEDAEDGEASGRSANEDDLQMSQPLLVDRSWRDSYLCIGPDSCIRRCCEACIQSPLFDHLVILVIIASSITLAIDTPRLDQSTDVACYLRQSDAYILAFFTAELLVKATSLGFFVGRQAYCKSGWNLLDLLVVLVSGLAELAELVPQFGALRPLRILRILRPIRLIARNAGMKLIIRSLFQAMPDVSNVFGVVLTFQIVFAILGMQLFMGTLATCSDPTVLTIEACAPAQSAPTISTVYHAASSLSSKQPQAPVESLHSELSNPEGRVLMHLASSYHGRSPLAPHSRFLTAASTRLAWENPSDVPGSFDDFKSVMLLLYVMSTGDDWDVVLFRTMDATTPGHAPVRDDYSSASLFSIAWMFVGCFFSMNLFVGNSAPYPFLDPFPMPVPSLPSRPLRSAPLPSTPLRYPPLPGNPQLHFCRCLTISHPMRLQASSSTASTASRSGWRLAIRAAPPR